MNPVARVRFRVRRARSQAPQLRVPFFVAPLQRKLQPLLNRRLRSLGVARPVLFIRELEDGKLDRHVEAAVAEYCALLPQFAPGPGSIDPAEGALLYGLVRGRRPATVVETGTASGISTTYLLAALARNGSGRLISIDLPFAADEGTDITPIVAGTTLALDDSSPLPPGKQPGWAVPDDLRDRWELRLGDARELLPALLDELGEIDIFFHDSLHTSEHMLFEFDTAWPHLAAGGVLLADDIFQRKHDALPAFARSVGRSFTTFGNLGIVVK